jgi:hypothetical protein
VEEEEEEKTFCYSFEEQQLEQLFCLIIKKVPN